MSRQRRRLESLTASRHPGGRRSGAHALTAKGYDHKTPIPTSFEGAHAHARRAGAERNTPSPSHSLSPPAAHLERALPLSQLSPLLSARRSSVHNWTPRRPAPLRTPLHSLLAFSSAAEVATRSPPHRYARLSYPVQQLSSGAAPERAAAQHAVGVKQAAAVQEAEELYRCVFLIKSLRCKRQ